MSGDRAFHLVLFGATGFVGRLTAQYLAGHVPVGTRVALAGRSAQRLASLRTALGPVAAGWDLLVADAADPPSLRAVADAARVVVTTVGPYARLGSGLLAACVAAGTDYADLTGEVLFVRDSIDTHHAAAAAGGTRIVHACGFDSVPSDLGVLALADAVRADGAGELGETVLVVTGMRGGVSGGTVASAMGQLDQVRSDPRRARTLADPHALSPDRAAEPVTAGPDPRWVQHDRRLGVWLAPFVMAPFNTRVVRRSNALQGFAYGRRFTYREAVGVPDGPTAPVRAAALAAGQLLAERALRFGPTRAVLDRVLPSPGEGPGERVRRSGYFRMRIHTTTSTGARYVARVEGRGDPGYAATAVMLGESALCLAVDGGRLPDRAGVLTPAAALGVPLVERLRAAGFTLAVERADG